MTNDVTFLLKDAGVSWRKSELIFVDPRVLKTRLLSATEECRIVDVATHQSEEKKQIRALTSKVQRKETEEILHITDRSRAVGETESGTKHS